MLEVVHEFLNKNRYLTMEKIIPFITSRFSKASININTNGIIVIVESLIKKNYILEGSKLSRERMLKNTTRKSIFIFIKNFPGTYLSRIAKELNLKKPIVEWHLSILLKFNCLKKITINGHEAYFNIKFNHEKLKLIHFMQREKYRKVVEYLKANQKGCTKTHLTKNLKMHPNTIKKYITRLEGFNIIFREKINNKDLFFLDRKSMESLKEII